MEKVICLLWARDGDDHAQFSADLLARLPVALKAGGARQLRLNIEDEISVRGEALRQSRGERQHDAMAQFWLPSANTLFRTGVDAVLSEHSDRWAGWVVAESTIIANTVHPPASAARTAGWSQTAFLSVPDRLSHAEWRSLWQDQHTRVAIETQANFEYVQNLIVHQITPDAPPYAAIVEECFPEAALADPFAFFDAVGDPGKFKVHLDRMMESCDRFIDRGTIDVIPTGQYTF